MLEIEVDTRVIKTTIVIINTSKKGTYTIIFLRRKDYPTYIEGMFELLHFNLVLKSQHNLIEGVFNFLGSNNQKKS
jgi:hypothetical protein